VTITSNTGVDPTAPNFRSYAADGECHRELTASPFAGIVSNGAVQIAKDVHAAIPTAKVFGGDGGVHGHVHQPGEGRGSASLYPLTQCTVATQNLTSIGREGFLAAYKAKYGVSNPDPYAIYGYEVMQLGLNTIKTLGAQGNSKSAVLKALFATKARNSPLGTYGFDKNGDTTLKSYGLYKVGSNGEPVFFKSLRRPRRSRLPDVEHAGGGPDGAPLRVLRGYCGREVEVGSLSPRIPAPAMRPIAWARRWLGRWGPDHRPGRAAGLLPGPRPDDRVPGRARQRPRR